MKYRAEWKVKPGWTKGGTYWPVLYPEGFMKIAMSVSIKWDGPKKIVELKPLNKNLEMPSSGVLMCGQAVYAKVERIDE